MLMAFGKQRPQEAEAGSPEGQHWQEVCSATAGKGDYTRSHLVQDWDDTEWMSRSDSLHLPITPEHSRGRPYAS